MKFTHWFNFSENEKSLQERLLEQIEKDGVDMAALHIARIIDHEVAAPYIIPGFLLHDIKDKDWNQLYIYQNITTINMNDIQQSPAYQDRSQAMNEIREIISYFTDLIDDTDLSTLLRTRITNNIIQEWSNNLLHTEKISA